MRNESISRNRKIEILQENSPTLLCETGQFYTRKTLYCPLHMRQGGHLVIYPATDHYGFFNFNIYDYYCTSQQAMINDRLAKGYINMMWLITFLMICHGIKVGKRAICLLIE